MEKITSYKHNAGRAAGGIGTDGRPSNAGRAECLRPVAPRRYCTVIWPTLVFTFGFFGRLTVRMPSSYSEVIFSGSASSGSVKQRSKRPQARSRRWDFGPCSSFSALALAAD